MGRLSSIRSASILSPRESCAACRSPRSARPSQQRTFCPDVKGTVSSKCAQPRSVFCCRSASKAKAPPKVAKRNPYKVSSKFYGVGQLKGNKKWRARVKHNGKLVEIGQSFDTEIAAVKAVDVWLRNNGRAAEANFDESSEFVPRVSMKSSKFRGVAWYKKTNQWHASIKVDGQQENLGYFDDEEAAARAFDLRAGPLGRPTNFDVNGVAIDYSA
jgi:hypothetical protein